MKLNVMKKNQLTVAPDSNLLDVYLSGIYNEYKDFTILKTLFKEVKIIRPISISKLKQIDILPDCTILQLKVIAIKQD